MGKNKCAVTGREKGMKSMGLKSLRRVPAAECSHGWKENAQVGMRPHLSVSEE